jgi:hypothetical protein
MCRQWATSVLAGCCVSLFCASLFGDSDPPLRTIDVTVRSAVDGKPISGAELVVERFDGSINPLPEDVDGRTITRAESNDRGRIVLNDLPVVPTRLTLKLQGYVSPAIANLDSVVLSRRMELFLTRPIEVNGVALDDLGAPLKDVEVAVQPAFFDSEGRVVMAVNPQPVKTDAAGNFRIQPVPDGVGTFTLSAKGHSFTAEQATRRLSKEPIKLMMSRTGELRVDLDVPLHQRGQAWVRVTRRVEKGAPPVAASKMGVDRGMISFPDLPIGMYEVTAAVGTMSMIAHGEVKSSQTTEVRVGPTK